MPGTSECSLSVSESVMDSSEEHSNGSLMMHDEIMSESAMSEYGSKTPTPAPSEDTTSILAQSLQQPPLSQQQQHYPHRNQSSSISSHQQQPHHPHHHSPNLPAQQNSRSASSPLSSSSSSPPSSSTLPRNQSPTESSSISGGKITVETSSDNRRTVHLGRVTAFNGLLKNGRTVNGGSDGEHEEEDADDGNDDDDEDVDGNGYGDDSSDHADFHPPTSRRHQDSMNNGKAEDLAIKCHKDASPTAQGELDQKSSETEIKMDPPLPHSHIS